MKRLNVKEIEAIIPHRHPFLLIDYIEDYEPGKYAVGYKCVSYREEFFKGHFPQEPVMPGVLIVEALLLILSQLLFFSCRSPSFSTLPFRRPHRVPAR